MRGLLLSPVGTSSSGADLDIQLFQRCRTALWASDLSPSTLGRAVPDLCKARPLGRHHGLSTVTRPAHAETELRGLSECPRPHGVL